MIKLLLTVLFLACPTQLIAAPNDSIINGDTAMPRKVLIIKGDSYLENAVTKILRDSLFLEGIAVETAHFKKPSNENPANYTAIIVFSAIKASGQVDPLIRKFMESKSNDPTSNIMLCTVYGEKWGSAPAKEDAISAATKTLNPALVASKILSSLIKDYLR